MEDDRPQPARVLDLAALGRVLWSRRVAFAFTVPAALVLAILYLNIVTHRYEVTLQLAPVERSQASQGSLGALGAIAGLDLSNAGSSSDFKIFIAALQSHAAAEALATNSELLRRLYPREWSDVDHTWREPSHSLLHPVVRALVSGVGVPVETWEPPSANRLYRFLQQEIEITSSRDSPIVTLRLWHKDPDIAKTLLSDLVLSVDRFLRDRALRRADGYIEYLTRKLQQESVAEYRQSLLQNLTDQEKKRMMAAANVSYAAEVFSGPSASDVPVLPSAIATFVIAVLAGLIGGSVIAYYLHVSRREFSAPLLKRWWSRA
jgi:capsular polysaccharide biosynthesis protein